MSTIRCAYSCDLCGLEKQWVEVPERDAKTHDVVQWIQLVAMVAFALDHEQKSPGCRPRALQRIMIPVDEGTEHVGEKTRN